MAVAAISASINLTTRWTLAALQSATRRAQDDMTASLMGSGSAERANANVSARRLRVPGSAAASMPSCNSPMETTDTATRSGSSPRGRPDSRAMKTEVSSRPTAWGVTVRRESGRSGRPDSSVSPGSAARSVSSSRSRAPESHRVRCSCGTMSAIRSPRTVSVTRSPDRTRSITQLVRLRSSRTPISMCYTIAPSLLLPATTGSGTSIKPLPSWRAGQPRPRRRGCSRARAA